MFISKKRLRKIENQIADLEKPINISSWDYGTVSLRRWAQYVERDICSLKKAADKKDRRHRES